MAAQAPSQAPERTLVDAILAGEVSLDDALTHYRPPTTSERVQTFAGVLARAAGDAYRSGTSAELRIAERGLALIGATGAAEWMRGFADYVAPGGDLGKDVAGASRALGNPAMAFVADPSIPDAAQNDTGLSRALTQLFPEALGSSIGILALPGPKGMGGVALRGAMVGAGQQFVEAKAHGADDEAAWIAFAAGGALGATEAGIGKFATPLGKILARADKASGGGLTARLWEGIKGGGAEFTQETLQSIGENIVAGVLYDEDRELIQGVLDAGIGGAMTGFLMGALAGGGARGGMAQSNGKTNRYGSVEPGQRGEKVETEPRATVDPSKLSPAAAQAAADLGVDPSTLEEAPEELRRFVQDRGGEVYVARGATKAAANRENAIVVNDSPEGLDAFIDHELAHRVFRSDPKATEELQGTLDTLAPALRAQAQEEYALDALATKRREMDRDLTPEEEQEVRSQVAPDEAIALLAQDFSGVVRLLRKNPEAFSQVKDVGFWRRLVRAVADFGRKLTGKPARNELEEAYTALAGPLAREVAPSEGIAIAKALTTYVDSLVGKAPQVASRQQAATPVVESTVGADAELAPTSVETPTPTRAEATVAPIPEPGPAPAPRQNDNYVGRRLLSFPAVDLEASIADRLTREDAALRERFPGKPESWYQTVAEKRAQARNPQNTEGDRAALELRRLGVRPLDPDAGGYTTEAYIEARETQKRGGKLAAGGIGQGPSFALYRRAFPTSSGASMDFGKVDQIRRVAQDAWLPVTRWRDAIASAGKVTDANDIVLMEELRRSGTMRRTLDEGAGYVDPLKKLVVDGPVTFDDAGTYLLARAAADRDTMIEARTGAKNGSGIPPAEAAKIIAAAETGPNAAKYAEIAAAFDRLTNRTLEIKEQSGLTTPEETARLREQEPKYAPQRTDERSQKLYGEAGRSQMGSARTRRKEFKSALGRSTQADNPLVFATMDLMSAIERGTWNDTVGRSLLDLARVVADPQVVTIDQTPTKKALVNGKVQDVPDLAEKANEIIVKENGVARVVRFGKGWETVAQAIKGSDAATADSLIRSIGHGLRWATRQVANASVRWNPFFWPVNTARDVLAAGMHATTDFGPAEAFKAANPKAVALAAKDVATKGPWLKRFENAGGPTAWYDLARTFEEQSKRIVRDIQDAQHPNAPWAMTRRVAGKIADALDYAGGIAENATRLSVFKYLIEEQGWTDARAAQYAKNITTNFEKRGTAAWLMSLHAFSNAGIQGTARAVKAMRTPWGQRLIAGSIAGSFLISAINRITGGDDEDGVPRWDKIPEFERRSNAILMLGEQKLKIPLPFVWNVFNALGTEMERAMFGDQTALETARAMGSTVAGALNPLGGEGDILDTLTPTLLDPLSQLERNRDYAGRAILPEKRDKGAPDSTLAWESTSPSAIAVAKKLNELSGGDAGTPGLVDVSPASIEFFLKNVFGGAGAEISRSVRIAEKMVNGEDIEQGDWPGYRRFAGSMGLLEQREFYKRTRELVRQQVRREKAGEPYDRDLWRLRKRVDRFDERIGELNDELRKDGVDRDAIRKELRDLYVKAIGEIRGAGREEALEARR